MTKPAVEEAVLVTHCAWNQTQGRRYIRLGVSHAVRETLGLDPPKALVRNRTIFIITGKIAHMYPKEFFMTRAFRS